MGGRDRSESPVAIIGMCTDHKINRLDELMPWRYAQKQA